MQIVSQLIHTFIPDHYDLSLTLRRAERKFDGHIVVTGQSLANDIRLHAKDLTITAATIDDIPATWQHSDDDELILSISELAPGQHTVAINYSGTIRDQLNGLYPCYYEHDGVKKELLVTQFESHYARQAFPCVDEPAAKATFALSLTTEHDVTVLSNMPASEQIVENNALTTRFMTTPRMSTYLLAFVVGELQSKTAETKNGIAVTVYATPAQPAASLDFALDHAVRTIEFFDEYFDQPYPLPKSDHVALPDFSSGAMENWGLVTYRETALLADPETTSVSARQYIATVISHELSHQWFGNLVTMKWWNNLWLNESFATLMEYVAVDALWPHWNIWQSFATTESLLALRRDSLDGVQSVQTEVNHPDELNTIFDGAIVYAKGARLLRMLQTYLGADVFRDGLRQYFAAHAYSNTTETDLWDALADVSGHNVAALMTPWISQPGLPLVTLSRQGDQLTLQQEQFFVGPHQPSDRLWPIPLGVPQLPALFTERQMTVTCPTTPLLNPLGSAHFITRYDAESERELLSMVTDQPLLIRLQLLNEQMMLARAGIVPSAHLIDWLVSYQHETAQPVWDIMAAVISELKKFVENDEAAEAALRQFVCDLTQPLYDQLGWDVIEGESAETTKLRSTIIGLTLFGRCQPAIDHALDVAYSTPVADIDPELRSSILAVAVRDGTDTTFVDTLLAEYQQSASAEVRADIGDGVTASKDPAVIQRLLALIKDTSVIRTQDTISWYVDLLRNRYARTETWAWLRDEWSWIRDTFAGDANYDAFPRYSALLLTTAEQLEEYRTFFTPMLSDRSLARPVELGLTELTGRVELIAQQAPAVIERLSQV